MFPSSREQVASTVVVVVGGGVDEVAVSAGKVPKVG